MPKTRKPYPPEFRRGHVRSSAAIRQVERQQFGERVVVGDVGRPAVGGSNGSVEGRVRVGEPCRASVVKARQRARLERGCGGLVARPRTCRIAGNRLVQPLDPFGRVEPADRRRQRLNVGCLPSRWTCSVTPFPRAKGIDDAAHPYHDVTSGVRADRLWTRQLRARPEEGRRVCGLETRPASRLRSPLAWWSSVAHRSWCSGSRAAQTNNLQREALHPIMGQCG